MWDVYREVADSNSYLITKHDTPFPPNLARKEWKFVGPHSAIAKDIAEDIARSGYYRLRTKIPYDSNATIGEPR
jgi:hypothetical protein